MMPIRGENLLRRSGSHTYLNLLRFAANNPPKLRCHAIQHRTLFPRRRSVASCYRGLMSQPAIFDNDSNVIWPVQPCCEKYCA
jgi:hypothetical protein